MNNNSSLKIINYCDTNYYLINGPEGNLLIDAGWNGKYSKFKKALNMLSIKMESIKYVLLTHHHHDHAALIQEIRNESNCRIIMHCDGVEFVKKGSTYTKETKQYNIWLWLLNKLLSPVIKLDYPPIVLKDNDIIITKDEYDIKSITGINGKIIHTPGHSKDSMSLLLDNGNAFVGDAAMNILKFFGHEYWPMEAEDYCDVYRSWNKLILYGAKRLFPAHGSCFYVEELIKLLESHSKSL